MIQMHPVHSAGIWPVDTLLNIIRGTLFMGTPVILTVRMKCLGLLHETQLLNGGSKPPQTLYSGHVKHSVHSNTPRLLVFAIKRHNHMVH